MICKYTLYESKTKYLLVTIKQITKITQKISDLRPALLIKEFLIRTNQYTNAIHQHVFKLKATLKKILHFSFSD